MKIGYLFDSCSVIIDEVENIELTKRIEYVNFTVTDPEKNEYAEKRITISENDLIALFNKFPKKGLKTSQTNIEVVKEKIRTMLKKYDYIIGCPVAKLLSGQYDSFIKIANTNEFKNKFFVYGKKNSASSTLFEIKKLDLIFQEYNELNQKIYKDCLKKLNTLVCTKILLFLTDLHRITLSGRISKIKGKIGKLLNLKVVLSLKDEDLILLKKGRSILKLINDSIKNATNEIKRELNNAKIEAHMFSFKVEEKLKKQIQVIIQEFVDNSLQKKMPPIFAVHIGEGSFAIIIIGSVK